MYLRFLGAAGDAKGARWADLATDTGTEVTTWQLL
jgi:hypothetical protein